MDGIDSIIDEKIEYWKKKLIDLSRRNNLISYRFTKSKSINIDLPSINEVIKDVIDEIPIRIAYEEGEASSGIWKCNEEDDVIGKKLYNIYLKARENLQEMGVNTSFLSIGMLHYKNVEFSDDYNKAPILLCPMEVERLTRVPKNEHRFVINTDYSEIQVNPALKEKLSNDWGIEIRDFDDEEQPQDYFDYLSDILSGQKSWSVLNEVFLDIFTYTKFIMYKDLTINSDLIKENPLVRAYVGDRNALQDDILDADRENFNDAIGIDVFKADSSQKRAIELAKAGATFVLQGPPGTGKSQTICNIISALIGRKKKILFVSQKKAALDVVLKRLRERGLDRYCLNLHTFRGNKKEIIGQFMRELQNSPSLDPNYVKYSLTNYLNTQSELNDFYEYLCKERGVINKSIYETRGELAKLHDVDTIYVDLGASLNYDSEQLASITKIFNDMDYINSKIDDPYNNLYFYYDESKNTILQVNVYKELINNVLIDINEIMGLIENIGNKYGLSLSTYDELDDFYNHSIKLNDAGLFIDLLSTRFMENKRILDGLYKYMNEIEDIKNEILIDVDNNFLDLDTERHKTVFYNVSGITKILNSSYRKCKKELDQYKKHDLKHEEWLYLLEKKSRYLELLKIYNNYKEKNSDDLSNLNLNDSIFSITNIKDKLAYVVNLYKEFNLDKSKFIELVSYMVLSVDELNIIKTCRKNMNDVNEYFINITLLEEYTDINSLKKIIKDLKNDVVNIGEFISFQNNFKKLNEHEKTFVKKYYESQRNSDISNSFLKIFYLSLLDRFEQDEKKLSPKNQIDYFVNEDYEVRNAQRFKIMAVKNDEKPKFEYESRADNEIRILRRENEKKRRLKPIRVLLTQISNLAFTLKPVFMMSPLTVSQYLQTSLGKFDVVIFDEASQIMPEDAVPCLVRANQAVIMGDTQQLPPTTFFLRTQDDDDVDEELEDLESFLSEASTRFRMKSLDWHYRSQNETLIAFSNRFFYENRLITFPNANPEDMSGLDFVYVEDGVYDRGKSRTNVAEARQVVNVYADLKKEYPDKSFGIIAFSRQQERAIRQQFEMVNVEIDSSIDSTVEELFVKNLETVQGDERDIILISIGYGRDSAGSLSYNFGPINREGGYKRLNVAITRSRFKTVVVASILPRDLDEDRINAEGLRFLKYYLDYAKNKNFSAYLVTGPDLYFDSPFEEAVYDAFVSTGYDVSSQVGCSGYRVDLAIKDPDHPGEYILGVECDGAQYHSSRYARDRDKVRRQVLENLGWNIHRIWSEDWLVDRPREMEKSRNRVDRIRLERRERDASEEEFEDVKDVNGLRKVELKDKFEKYVSAELPVKTIKLEFDSYDRLKYSYQKNEIKERMNKLIELESPITISWMYKRVQRSFGIGRMGRRINDLFNSIFTRLVREKGLQLYGDTISTKPIDIVTPLRISTEKQRPFTEIPKEELAHVIIVLLDNNLSMSRDALQNDIGREIFAYNRTGKKIDDKIDEAIDYLVDKNCVEPKNGVYVLTTDTS